MKIVDTNNYKIMSPSDIANPQREILGQYNPLFANLDHTDLVNYSARARHLQGQAIVSAVTSIWSAISAYLQVRKLELQLGALSNRTLNDIGLSREQIPAVARGAYNPQSNHILNRAASKTMTETPVADDHKVAA